LQVRVSKPDTCRIMKRAQGSGLRGRVRGPGPGGTSGSCRTPPPLGEVPPDRRAACGSRRPAPRPRQIYIFTHMIFNIGRPQRASFPPVQIGRTSPPCPLQTGRTSPAWGEGEGQAASLYGRGARMGNGREGGRRGAGPTSMCSSKSASMMLSGTGVEAMWGGTRRVRSVRGEDRRVRLVRGKDEAWQGAR